MFKRLFVGCLKGLFIGAALAAAVHYGLGWTRATGLLAYLLSMGVGATAGVLAGTPPWRQDTWIESVLKAVAGLGVGALAYWAAGRWAAAPLPFTLPTVADTGTPWTDVPLLYLSGIGALFGALVELDNSGDPPPARPKRGGTKVRVAGGRVEDAQVVVERARKGAAAD